MKKTRIYVKKTRYSATKDTSSVTSGIWTLHWELRWVLTSESNMQLQQKWVSRFGVEDWRKVPIIKEDEDATKG